ncbi:MAG: hypothetical protein AAF716_14335 [Cyanobacteria bacterium P01_D01_bin.1]
MKTTMYMTAQPLTKGTERSLLMLTPTCSLPTRPDIDRTMPGEVVKHILLGSPGAIRQTIHLLHSLHYSETVLWSPVLQVEEPLVITPEQGEAMSLLRKMV